MGLHDIAKYWTPEQQDFALNWLSQGFIGIHQMYEVGIMPDGKWAWRYSQYGMDRWGYLGYWHCMCDAPEHQENSYASQIRYWNTNAEFNDTMRRNMIFEEGMIHILTEDLDYHSEFH